MKNILTSSLLAIFAVCILMINSCTDPLDVGSELLDEDRANVGFTDTLNLQAKTVIGDSVSVYITTNSLVNDFLFGRMEDSYFGITESAAYLQPLLSRDLGGEYLDFPLGGEAIIDSIILILPLDSSAVFGDISGTFGVDVFEVTEPIEVDANEAGNRIYYSNTSFATNPVPLASTSFIPSFDSVFVKNTSTSFTTGNIPLIVPHLRIPLDPMLGQRFLDQDTMTYVNDSTFLEFFQGLYIKPTGTSAGLLDLNLNQSWAGMHIFYQEGGDTLKYIMEIGTIGRRLSQYTHEYTGSVVDPFLESSSINDSLLFLQGLQGLLVEFKIPELANLGNKVINQAILELTVASFDDYDLEAFPPVDQIVAMKRNDEGNLVFIDDVSVASNSLEAYFGGQPIEQSDGSFTYRFNISIHTQYVMDGSEPETIYLAIFPRTGNPNRVILKGSGATNNPAILKISFTDI